MLLKALHDFAETRDLLEKVHLQDRRIHLLIPIDSEGELVTDGLMPLTSKDEKGKDFLGRKLRMPRFPGENNGGKAYFLAESCVAILGIDKKTGEGVSFKKKGNKKNPAKSFLHFWRRIEDAQKATSLPVFEALLQFRKRYLYVEGGRSTHRLSFIQLGETKSGENRIGARTISGNWEALEKLTLTFQVDGNFIFDPAPGDPLAQYWKRTYRTEAFSGDADSAKAGTPAQRGLCLVTEQTDAPTALSHKPRLLGIPGLTSGGYVVSFAKECPAFSSYGFKMGQNAPVSEEAAASYALALQEFLDSENHSLRIGSAVVCFWAPQREEESHFMAKMLSKADPKAVAEFLNAPWVGVDRRLIARDQFYSVTLSGNAARVVVRHWMQTTVEQARLHLRNWFLELDLRQLKAQKKPPLALKQLALAVVREPKDLQADIVTQLSRAALEGTAPPAMLLKPILYQFHSALVGDTPKKGRFPYSHSRFALLKLILNRNRKEGDPMIEPEIFETDDSAYNCGRLLAVLADAQAKAHEYGMEGPGVAERYFGAASVSPSSVFPLLLRLNRHHLEKIGKSEKYRSHAGFIEVDIQHIMALFKPEQTNRPPQFPRHLDLQAQGRFAIGFYQQKAFTDAERRDHMKRKSENADESKKEKK